MDHALVRRLAAAGLAGVLALAGQPGVLAATPGTVTLRGTLSARIADDFANHRSATDGYELITANGTFSVQGPVPPSALGTEVALTGTPDGAALQLAAGGVQRLGPAKIAAAGVTSIKLAVILINFTNDTSQPYTPAAAANTAFNNPDSVAAFYNEETFGKLGSLTGTVYGWYTISASSASSCNYGPWATAAEAAAASHGFVAANFDHVVVAWPQTPALPFTSPNT